MRGYTFHKRKEVNAGKIKFRLRRQEVWSHMPPRETSIYKHGKLTECFPPSLIHHPPCPQTTESNTLLPSPSPQITTAALVLLHFLRTTMTALHPSRRLLTPALSHAWQPIRLPPLPFSPTSSSLLLSRLPLAFLQALRPPSARLEEASPLRLPRRSLSWRKTKAVRGM